MRQTQAEARPLPPVVLAQAPEAVYSRAFVKR
jgi:hypothetical protein